MENNAIPCPLISDFLSHTSADIASGKLKASEGLLSAVRIGRIFFTDARLQPLTRELLGYSEEDAAVATEAIKGLARWVHPTSDLCVQTPAHRTLRGFCLPLLTLIQEKSEMRPSVRSEFRFCKLSISELELLVERADATNTPYLVVEYDENLNMAFICKTSDIKAMLQQIRQFVLECVQLLTRELQPDPAAADDNSLKKERNIA